MAVRPFGIHPRSHVRPVTPSTIRRVYVYAARPIVGFEHLFQKSSHLHWMVENDREISPDESFLVSPTADRLRHCPFQYERLTDGLSAKYLLIRCNRSKFPHRGKMKAKAACVCKWEARLTKTALITSSPVRFGIFTYGRK